MIGERLGGPGHLVAAGFALIGVTYGLARFAYGLFLPAMRDEVGLGPALSGIIGGGAYLGYGLAIVASALLAARLGPRRLAVAAGLVATVGMAVMAVSPSAAVLAVAVLAAGMSTGLSSPPLADAVAMTVPAHRQGRANAVINSGTSAGVVLSGPIALAATGHWREAYLSFAVIAGLVTLWVAFTVPGRAVSDGDATRVQADHGGTGGLWRPEAAPLLAAAFLMGFASAIYWTFAPDTMVGQGGLAPEITGLAWVVVGLAGFAGGTAGDLVRRFGIAAVHRGALLSLAVAVAVLVAAPGQLGLVLVSAALFGAAYIMLTGVYLVWGVGVYRERPAVGLGLPFLMIAVGQVAGSPAAGLAIEALGHAGAFTLFAGLAVATMLLAAPRCEASPAAAAAGPARCEAM